MVESIIGSLPRLSLLFVPIQSLEDQVDPLENKDLQVPSQTRHLWAPFV